MARRQRSLVVRRSYASEELEDKGRTSGQIAPHPRFTQELQGIERSQRSFNLKANMSHYREKWAIKALHLLHFSSANFNQPTVILIGVKMYLTSAQDSLVAPFRRFFWTPSSACKSARFAAFGDDMVGGITRSGPALRICLSSKYFKMVAGPCRS